MGNRSVLTAAGGVLWRDGTDGPEVLLVHRPHRKDWSLPKGKPDPGENDLDTAVREVREETGVPFAVGARLGSVCYRVKDRPKRVTYWSMRARADSVVSPLDADEIDDATWQPIDEAKRMLTYPQDSGIVDEFVRRGRGLTSLVLVRHASAGKRSQWSGKDADRPLDARGQDQASALGRTLAAFAPDRVLAAPLERCERTAEPIARRRGLPLKAAPFAADAALEGAAADSLARLRKLATDGTKGATVVVSQGDMIGAALEAICGPAEAPYGRRKGSAWVFTARKGKVVSADYYPTMLATADDAT